MSEYFSKGANVKVELDLSNYAKKTQQNKTKKTDLKNATGVDT